LHKLSPIELRQICEWLDDLIENELQFRPEFDAPSSSANATWPIRKADDGIRTRDLRFTKPLLYQLSYVGDVADGL
jgi:hypothetical protein